MRKLFFALMCTMAVIFTACNSGNPLSSGINVMSYTDEQVANLDHTTYKCWHVAVEIIISNNPDVFTQDGYTWATERMIVEIGRYYVQENTITKEDNVKDPNGVIVTRSVRYCYSEAPANSKEGCDNLQKELEKKEQGCWEISCTVQGQTVVYFYYWGEEDEATAYAKAQLKNVPDAKNITVKEAKAKDENACKALNDNLNPDGGGNPGGGDNPGGGGSQGGQVDVRNMTDAQIESLDDTVEKCWYWNMTKGTEVKEGYVWSTEQEIAGDIKAAYDMYKAQGTVLDKAYYSPSNKNDAESCVAQNN